MTEKALKCDVLVIGAGPAGTSLAYYLSREGIRTILVDKKSEIEKPVRCAEYVPASLPGLFDIHISGVELKTKSMTTYLKAMQYLYCQYLKHGRLTDNDWNKALRYLDARKGEK